MQIPNFLYDRVPHGYCNDEFPFDMRTFLTRVLGVVLKNVYSRFSWSAWAKCKGVLGYDESVNFIYESLKSGKPFMAGKIGTCDMEALMRYIDVNDQSSCIKKLLGLTLGNKGIFWWDNWSKTGVGVGGGVFPITQESIDDFVRIFMSYCDGFDAIASWVFGERRIFNLLCPAAKIIDLSALAPTTSHTWYGALEGKKVLVIHQYVKTIKSQYEKNVEFHKGQRPLPRFKELIQYRPVNSIGGKCKDFACWKDALQHMIDDISKIDFDVALLGCGLYGVPLSAYIKRIGKQAIYTGGGTQAIFGVKGRRWDNLGIYNEHWVRPSLEDIPENMEKIEGGCFI